MSGSLFNDSELKKFIKTYKGLEGDDEFEIMFGGYNKTNKLNMQTYLHILKHLKYYSDENKLKYEYTETLDISYNYDSKNFSTYRISIKNIESINKHLSLLYNKDNNIIFSILVSKIMSDKFKDLSIINKIKNFDNTYNLDNYDIRVRLSKEKKLDKSELTKLINLGNVNKLLMNIRMKSRFSVIIETNSDVELRIDLTSVKQGININKLSSIAPNYELEIDFLKKKKLTSVKDKKYIDKLMNLISFVKKITIESNYITTNKETENIIKLYKKILLGDENAYGKTLYGPSVKSLEAVHIVDYLPNKFAVTDKADGDRCLGLITNGKLYLIFTNLNVKFSGINVDKKYNNTIVDGEYILNTENNKYIFALFDILYYKNENVQDEENLDKRYNILNELVINCFKFDFDIKKYSSDFNIDKIVKYYEDDVLKYLKYLNNYIKSSKNETIVSIKYFIFLLGGSDTEIFRYSALLWNLYTNKHSDKVPYILDGLIHTPLKQKYTKIAKEQKHRIYKWKPPNQNSIDFFVRIEKDKNEKSLSIYDKSENNLDGTYQIINLYVGKSINNIEIPVLFRKYDNLHIAKISEKDGVIRDLEGDIIQDNTVVEFYYNNNENRPEFRWTPIRTRYDKTESVNKLKKKYGNNAHIANAIWNSIQQNITIDDLIKLSNEKTYDEELNKIKNRIDATVVASERQKDVYYQKITNFAKPLRQFHNYIKSNIIFSYCSEKIIDNKLKKMDILDVGFGQGGDLLKMFHSRVGRYVGFDPDSNGIYSSTNGAISRYNNFRNKYPSFPRMEFLVADAGAKLNYTSQYKKIGRMSASNEKLLKKVFGKDEKSLVDKKFDIFNCQLMLHFLLKNKTTWYNFCDNINNFLNDNGYLLITSFDGKLLHKKFKENNGKIVEYYVENGKKKKLFEFISSYDHNNSNIDNLGLSYNAYVSIFKEDEIYDTEYLISDTFLINELSKHCNMQLIETDNFYNIYKMQKHFFENVAPKEELKDSRNFYMQVLEYYNLDNDINKACLEFTKLHKYYIFKKFDTNKSKITIKVKKKSKKPKKGGGSLIDKYLNSDAVFDI